MYCQEVLKNGITQECCNKFNYFVFFYQNQYSVFIRSGRISRSPTIIISYIMKFYGLSFDDAYQFVNNKRKIFPNYGFIKIMKEIHH